MYKDYGDVSDQPSFATQQPEIPCETLLRDIGSRFQTPVNCNSPYPLHKEFVTQSNLPLGTKDSV